jgi:hypothetical protein
MKFFLSSFVTFFSISLFAQSTDSIQIGENLENFAKRNLEEKSIRYGNRVDLFILDIKKFNPNITNWNKLDSGTKLYLDYPFPEYVSGANYAKELKTSLHQSEEGQKFSLSGYYSNTIGSYSESTNNQTIKSDQNFPVTIGFSSSATTASRTHFLLASLYWAKSTSGKINGISNSTINDINIPGEIGYNFYYQYYLQKNKTGIYLGYDYEELNTFNTNQLLVGDPVKNISNKINYGTLGFNQSYEINNSVFNSKISFSNILSSKSSLGEKLTGYKYLVYLSLRPEGRISYNIIYKHHDLKGPTNLSINRYGIGIGFQFF